VSSGSSAAVASGKIFPTLKSEEGEPTGVSILYFCTSKGVYIFTFLVVKKVNLYFCTAKPEWHTRGHSNNYMGMTKPIRNTNVLGDHQVGFSDKQVESAEDAEVNLLC